MINITGTIFSNNNFTFYVNGKFIVQDPIPSIPHNAVNVTFRVPANTDITFAIDARDLASTTTGLEFDDKCVGSGGLRAIFSNGVVTNDKWACSTYHYGPVNWRECFGAQNVRNFSSQLLPDCRGNSTPPLVGCYARFSPENPLNWTMPDFDDSHWEYSLEYLNESQVGWGLPPEGCTDPNTYISSELDSFGNQITCPQNLDWGDSKFIWRPDLSLDNYIRCRYTFKHQTTVGGRDEQNGCSQLVAINSLIIIFILVNVIFFI